MSMFVPVYLLNNSNKTIYVTGSLGNDLNGININQAIGNGTMSQICGFNEGSDANRWDWVFLGDHRSQPKYQIYMQNTKGGRIIQDLGFYNSSINESNDTPQSIPFGDPLDAATGQVGGTEGSRGYYFYAFTSSPD